MGGMKARDKSSVKLSRKGMILGCFVLAAQMCQEKIQTKWTSGLGFSPWKI